MLVAEAQHRVAAAVVEVDAGGHVRTEVVAVTLFGDLVRHGHVDAGEILLRDEVDDAGDGVRTIGGHGRTGQRVNAADQGERDVVEIDAALKVGRDDALAIEQHDVAVGTEAAKIDVGRTGRAVVHGRTDVRHDAGNGAQNFFSGVRLLEGDRVSRGHVDRRGLHEVGVADKAAGNDDRGGLVRFGRGISLRSGLLRERRSGNECERDCERCGPVLQRAKALKILVGLHVSSPFNGRPRSPGPPEEVSRFEIACRSVCAGHD